MMYVRMALTVSSLVLLFVVAVTTAGSRRPHSTHSVVTTGLSR